MHIKLKNKNKTKQ